MKCQAAVLYEIGSAQPYKSSQPIRIEDVELDPPGPGEVCVKVAAAGLCHSDLSVVNGARPRPLPMAIGHEAAGVVYEVGPGVDDLAVGDHVVFVFVPSCGACIPCGEGRPALCEPGAKANVAGSLLGDVKRIRLNGEYINHHVGVSCFAQYTVVSQCSLVKIDKRLPLDQAALFGCAVITGVGAVANTAALKMGATAIVVGLGGTGLAALLGARAAGARKLIGIDLLPGKLAIAQELGADAVLRADEDSLVEKVRELTGGGGDYVFECVGAAPAMELAYALTRRGGTTVSSGLSDPKHNFSIQHVNLVAEERTIKGSYLGSCVPKRDIPDYIAMYQAGRLPIDKLMSEKIGLHDVNEGFDRLAGGETIRQLIVF